MTLIRTDEPRHLALAYRHRGDALSRSGQYDQAIADCSQGLLAPTTSSARVLH
ncbi:tetratricopeptide repeat protein [Vineibacter terrae]|uniref:tetratricopeptide repeat protein n=1 Tax=Vineibacter terrae TaxID=2586908 RepID=UPI002E338ABE|nr:tetratricopeptide repeat protein [Vineibacter terrae]HEX2892205.1 tetratricopeptide repeat protein [Vineibacter terrae]